jgi:DNA-binding LacI/PurR family transcriptional regulator
VAVGRPTHHDVARRAGTSQTTVSLVLGRRTGGQRISDATRQAVLRAARELGYVPDLSARRLRGAATERGPHLVLAVLRPAGALLDPTTHLVDALDACLAALPGAPQLVLERYAQGGLMAHAGLPGPSRFHGAVVTGLAPADLAALEEAEASGGVHVPLVAFQRRLVRGAYVDVDNAGGAALATRHLLERGRRRIVALTHDAHVSAAQRARVDGYRRAVAAAGLAPRVVELERRAAAGAAAAAERLARGQHPDAVLALVGPHAVGVLHGLARAGRRVPDDVAVLSYEELSYTPFLAPPLTCVRLPYQGMARAAADWLVAAAQGEAQAPLRRTFEAELIVRAST